MDLKRIEDKIITIQGKQVILDSDVAEIYGVETKRVNEAIRNNPEKFPDSYIIVLTDIEKTEVVEIFDHLAKLKFSPVPVKGISEKGLYFNHSQKPESNGNNDRNYRNFCQSPRTVAQYF